MCDPANRRRSPSSSPACNRVYGCGRGGLPTIRMSPTTSRFQLVDLEGEEPAEVARRLGMRPGTVRAHLCGSWRNAYGREYSSVGDDHRLRAEVHTQPECRRRPDIGDRCQRSSPREPRAHLGSELDRPDGRTAPLHFGDAPHGTNRRARHGGTGPRPRDHIDRAPATRAGAAEAKRRVKSGRATTVLPHCFTLLETSSKRSGKKMIGLLTQLARRRLAKR